MTDRREEILVRLLDIAGTIADAPGEAARNVSVIPEKKRPFIVLLDGDEATDESAYGRGRPAITPVVMAMTPELYIFLDGKPQDVGTELNTRRSRLIKAVLTDESLIALCKDGDIRYGGMATGFSRGRNVEAEAGLSFTLHYLLRPALL